MVIVSSLFRGSFVRPSLIKEVEGARRTVFPETLRYLSHKLRLLTFHSMREERQTKDDLVDLPLH